jgi:hypothetical protein
MVLGRNACRELLVPQRVANTLHKAVRCTATRTSSSGRRRRSPRRLWAITRRVDIEAPAARP